MSDHEQLTNAITAVEASLLGADKNDFDDRTRPQGAWQGIGTIGGGHTSSVTISTSVFASPPYRLPPVPAVFTLTIGNSTSDQMPAMDVYFDNVQVH